MRARGGSASLSWAKRRFGRTGSWALALALGATSCRLPPIPASEPSTTADTAAAPVPAPAPAAAVARAPVELLPDRTDLVVTVAGVRPLLRLFDWPRVSAVYREQFERMEARTVQAVGHNLWDPSTWPKIGVDQDGPIGVAMLDAHGSATCVFFTLADPRTFREFLEALGSKLGVRVDPVFEDRGVVLAHQPDASMSVVLRDRFAFVVFNHREGRRSHELARELASIDQARALAATPRWREAVGSGAGRDLQAFVDLRAMTQIEPEDGGPSEVAPREERGADAWEVALGSPGPLVIDLSLSETAVRGTIRARVEESGLLRRALRGGGAPPLALKATSDRVVLAAAASFDVAAATDAADAWLRSRGGSLDAWLAELKATKGLDLRAVLDAQDGTASVAWSIKDPQALMTGTLAQLTVSVALGLKDPARQRAMLDALTAKPTSVPGSRGVTLHRARSGEAVLTVPDWRSLHLAVVGATLMASTDVELLRRVERDAVGAPTRPLAPEVASLLTAPEAAAAVLVDAALPLGASVRRPVAPESGPAQVQPYERFPEVARAKIDAVPPSAAYRAKLAEWRRLAKKVQRSDEELLRRAAGPVAAAADSLGVLAFNVREVGDELVLDVGQFFGPGSVFAALAAIVQARSLAAADELHEERLRLEQELTELWVRAVERALGVTATP